MTNQATLTPHIIVFTGKEGQSYDQLPLAFKNWEDANKQLSAWTIFAPEGGGYDKVHFTIVWDNGETYIGRIDLTKHGNANLQQHIKQHLTYILSAEYEYYDQYKPEAQTLIDTIQF